MTVSTPSGQFDRLSVLIVDDDDLLADYVAIELEALGCATRTAGNAQAALGCLDPEVNLLVTDWQMPGMDGMELVRRARAQRSAEEHLHIAMMTAREDAEGIRKALEAGVDDFLYKPIDPVQLELTVESARRNRLLHRRLRRRNGLLARAHQRTREALRRVQADIDAAARLHERLLPRRQQYGPVEVAYLYRPAASLGGDTIGMGELDGGGVLFFVVDVMGHGVPAALSSFHLHHRLKQMRPATPEDLVDVLGTINRELAAAPDDHYATVLCGILRPDQGEGWLVRAGHPAPLLQSLEEVRHIDAGGSMPVGLFAEAEFTAVPFTFPPGARLSVYSDGLCDAFGLEELDDPAGELARILVAPAGERLAAGAARLNDALSRRMPATGFDDDVSLLMLEHGAAGDGDGGR